MQKVFQKKYTFFILYALLAIVDFLGSIYNLVRRLIEDGFSASECFSSVAEAIYLVLPLVAFVIISKKTAEIDDLQKRLKIKKFVIIYIAACFLLAIIKYILVNRLSIFIPTFIFGLFYSSSMFSLIFLILKYHFFYLIFPLAVEICFMVISISFISSISAKTSEEEFSAGFGKISTGYKIGIACIVILSIQTAANIALAITRHKLELFDFGENGFGAAFLFVILIATKLLCDLILLPAIPLSIIGLVKCASQKEIEQERQKRILGKKINIICLVIAVAELALIW